MLREMSYINIDLQLSGRRLNIEIIYLCTGIGIIKIVLTYAHIILWSLKQSIDI